MHIRRCEVVYVSLLLIQNVFNYRQTQFRHHILPTDSPNSNDCPTCLLLVASTPTDRAVVDETGELVRHAVSPALERNLRGATGNAAQEPVLNPSASIDLFIINLRISFEGLLPGCIDKKHSDRCTDCIHSPTKSVRSSIRLPLITLRGKSNVGRRTAEK